MMRLQTLVLLVAAAAVLLSCASRQQREIEESQAMAAHSRAMGYDRPNPEAEAQLKAYEDERKRLHEQKQSRRRARLDNRAIVAVFDVQDDDRVFDGQSLTQLADYFATRLGEIGFRVSPRDELRTKIQESKAQGLRSCFDESCQIEIGKALSAEMAVSTKVLRFGVTCILVSTLYDLKTELSDRSALARTNCAEASIADAVDSIVTQFAKPD